MFVANVVLRLDMFSQHVHDQHKTLRICWANGGLHNNQSQAVLTECMLCNIIIFASRICA